LNMEFFVEGEAGRLFLNTRIGCRSRCKYCYLPMLDFDECDNKTVEPIAIIKHLNAHTDFKKGKFGTIFSIGCYSDCWDPINKNKTILLLKLLLKWGNPIQLSTKNKIIQSELELIKNEIQWTNQLSVYISCPILTNNYKYEINTGSVQNRLKTIKACLTFNIPAILYIKPVIHHVTIKDIDLYIKIVEKYKVPVVVGESFSLQKNNIPAPIGNGFLFCENKSQEHKLIIKILSEYTAVYYNSSEVVESYRSI